MFILISILAGVSIVVARIINSNLALKIGIFQGTIINYVVGLFFSILFMLLSRELSCLSPTKIHDLPLWAYLGGILGVFVVVLSSYITPKISAFYLTLMIFIGQLFVGIALDYFIFKQLSIAKIVGGIFVLLGLSYNLKLDKCTLSK